MKKSYQPPANVLRKRRDAWVKKLADVGPVLRGSLVTAQRGNHTAHQLTVSIKGKTHTVYVPPDMVKEVTEWIRNYKRTQVIMEKISTLSMALIHRHGPESRAAAKRSAQGRRSQ